MLRKLLPALMAVALLVGGTGCSGRKTTGDHAHVHEYRHGYYNPVDGYFHDDHWHYSGPYTKHYKGPYPAKARSVTTWHQGEHPKRVRSAAYHYHR